MNYYFRPVFSLATFVFLLANTAQANNSEHMVIALKTDQFELTETDISDLAVGEAQTITTDSGKVLDILRTVDGVEIYVDGELLDMNIDEDGVHEDHVVRKHVEVICDSAEECDKNIVIHAGDDDSGWVSEDGEDIDLEELHQVHENGDEHKVVVIRKKMVTKD